MNTILKLLNFAKSKIFGAAFSNLRTDGNDAIYQIYKSIDILKNDPNFKGVVRLLYMLFTQSTVSSNKESKKWNDASSYAKQEIKKLIKEAMKKLLKAAIKFIGSILKWVLTMLWPWGAILLGIVLAIYFFLMLFPSISNLYSFSYGFNKAEYYDTDLFEAVKNKETMLENLYERTADTSYYQRFANSEISDFLGFAVPNMEEEQTKYGKSYKEAAKDAQAGFTGFYTMDERETAHDANFNLMTNVIQANTLDSANNNRETMQGYFRDLFDKEVNFVLSEQFLRQANTYVQDMGNFYNNQLQYPEMFTKPLAYTVDFNRIDLFTEVKDNQLGYAWKDYTYTTKRVTKEDIGNTYENIVRNVNELDYASSYYDSSVSGTIPEDAEGKIASWPSPFVWEYAVYKKDYYKVYNDGTGQIFEIQDDGTIDNEYNSEYLTFVNDETGDIEQVRLFYELESSWDIPIDSFATVDDASLKNWFSKISDAIINGWNNFIDWLMGDSDEEKSAFKRNKTTVRSYGFLGDGYDYKFKGDIYCGLASDLEKTFSTSKNMNPYAFSSFTKVTEDGEWLVIDIPTGYRLPSDKPAYTINEDGIKTSQEREINTIKIRKVFNKYPKVHLQNVQLTDNNDELAVSSQNLINYKYYRIKTVTEGYRNTQQYIDGWSDWISENDETLKSYADRNLITAMNNRIYGVAKTVGSALVKTFAPEEHSSPEDFSSTPTTTPDYDEKYGDVTENEALINIMMDYPEEVLSLSLYMYERNLVKDKQENEVWVWNYSVNNYFKTDNEKMDSYEYFQKYMYLWEELNMNDAFFGSVVLDPLLSEYNENRPWLQGKVDLDSMKTQLRTEIQNGGGLVSPYVTGKDRSEVFWSKVGKIVVDELINPIAWINHATSLFGNIKHTALQMMGKEMNPVDIADLLEKITGKMHTAYLNLGTVRKSNEANTSIAEFYSYIPNYNEVTASENQFVIGMDVAGKDRGGEGSLISTFHVNTDLYNEAISYSYKNNEGSAVLPSEVDTLDITFTNDADIIKNTFTNWWEGVKEFFDLSGGYTANKTGYEPQHFTVPVSADEHDHYQYDYWIEDTVPSATHSGVYDSSKDGKTVELPLEVRSVRDYGLASILNYVDSVTVEFYSGAWYDEVYLKKEIGEALYSEYADVYSTYSYSQDDWFNKTSSSVSLKGTMSGKAVSGADSSYEKSVSIIGDGYYPKEMREDASDKIVELFEQNNKKRLFQDLVNSIDSKIFEVTNEYDQVMWDEEKEGILKIGDKEFNLLTGDYYALDRKGALDNVPFNVDVVNEALVGGTAVFRLLNREGNPIGADDYDFEANQIYRITNEDSKFYYYMPEIKYTYEKGGLDDEPNRIVQLLIPKRYYRNWVKTLTLNGDNGDDYPPDKVFQMSILDRIRTLILRKTVIPEGEKKPVNYLKTADDSLPSSNIDAILRGLSVLGTGYNLGADKDYSQANLPTSIPGSGKWPTMINPYEIRYEYNAGNNTNAAYGRSPYQTYQGTNGNIDSNVMFNKLSGTTLSMGGAFDDDGNVIEEPVEVRKYWGTGANKGKLQENPPLGGILYDINGEPLKVNNGTSSEKQYYQYILDTYSQKNFRNGINRFTFITDSDVEKVFVIDEVATFTGRFMYTYKDTLLATGDSLDPDTTKGILSAYAMDRYIFLDGWDIKLLTEEIIDVSFMFMNVQPRLENMSISQYIKEKSSESASSIADNPSIIDKLKQAILDFLEPFIDTLRSEFAAGVYDKFYENAYLYAVPATRLDEIQSMGTGDWSSDSDIRQEVEEYTHIIFSGFLFNKSLPEQISGSLTEVLNEYRVQGDINNDWSLKYDLLGDHIKYEMDSSIADGMLADAAGGADVDTFVSNVEKLMASKGMSGDTSFVRTHFTSLVNATSADDVISALNGLDGTVLKDVLSMSDGQMTVLMGNVDYSACVTATDTEADAVELYKANAIDMLNYFIGQGGVNTSYTWPYSPSGGPGVLASAKEMLTNLLTDLLDLLDTFKTGFEITSEDYSLCMKIKLKDSFPDEDGLVGVNSSIYLDKLENVVIPNMFNQYIQILGYKQECSAYEFDGFQYDYKIKKGFRGDSWESGTDWAKCYVTTYTYSLKCSDEIANKVKDGRYYSYLSQLGMDSNQDNHITDSSIEHIKDVKFVQNWTIDNSFVSDEEYGSLINVSSEQLIKDLSGEGIYDDEITITGFNGGPTYKTTLRNLWRPQIKIFDNLQKNGVEVGYLKGSMKELLYGAYLDNNGSVDGNINISTDTAVDSTGHYKNGAHLHKVTGTAGTKNNFFIRFIHNNFDDTNVRDLLINRKPVDGLMGFKLWEEDTERVAFTPDSETSREEEVFQDKFKDVYLDSKVAAINPIEVLYGGSDSTTSTSSKADDFVAFLNRKYGKKAKEIVQNAHYAYEDGTTLVSKDSQSFAITGFVLVPRITDRRDEPTLYPLYRYYGGTKKKIIPEEQIKYFEGLTYDSWKNKMTVTKDSDETQIKRYVEEMNRLSNYIYSYFTNFEAYVPYNVITDSDLEIRGTAGYADLLTQYTLYPSQTIAYTNLFVSEANKAYWNDICEAFEIPHSVIAQLLQGIAETRIKYLGEDAAALIAKDTGTYDHNVAADISSKRRELIGASRGKEGATGFYSHLEVTTSDGTMIPILGIMAIDNIPDKDLTPDELEDPSAGGGSTGGTNIVDGGIMITNHTGASAISGITDVITGTDAADLYSKAGSIPSDAKKILISLSALDVQNSGSPTAGIDTVQIRRLIKAITHAAPEAQIYFFPVTPVVGNTPSDDGVHMNTDGYNPDPWTADTLNAAVQTANTKIKEYIDENVPKAAYVSDATDAILSDNGTASTSYTSDKYSLNANGFKKLIEGASSISEDDYITPEYHDKSTYYYSPNGKNIQDFEIEFDIENDSFTAGDKTVGASSINDGRLIMEDAIQYASVRLYKSTQCLGDLLKGVYASFYSDKFVKALIVVTEDNATNLARDPEHGVWYRPTENDIKAAFDLLSDEDKNLINWRENIPHEDLTEVYGINRLQEAFSYIKNQNYRKTLVTYSMNSGGSANGVQGITLSGDWEVGTFAEATKAAAQQTISGQSFFGGTMSGTMIDYITSVCADFSTPEKPLDPALVMALIMVESGGKSDIVQYGGGPGRGLAQHSVPGGLTASAMNKNGTTVTVNFPYDEAFNPVKSIEYIVINFAGQLQSADYDMHPLTAIKTHNLPVTLSKGRLSNAMKSKYPLTPEGDLAYLWNYENGLEYDGYHLTHEGVSGAERAYAASESEYRTKIPMGENFGYGCPRYCSKILQFYVEEYANGDLFGGINSAGNKRDYSEEIWESEYLKYENSGVELITGYVSTDDVDELVQMTANYRNNNTEQSEYGYTYLDFFREIPSVQNGSNEFTGDMGDSLVLNAMTYLGAHYSQGRAKDAWGGVVYSRTSHAENMGGNHYTTPWGKNYSEGTFADGNKWAFDCSSFGTQMYVAMGYNLQASTCSTLRSKLSPLLVGNAGSVELKTGDLLISPDHTIIWMGPYTANYGGLFDDSTLRILGAQIVRRSGTEVLSYANSNVVGKDAYIHCGGYRGGGSCVNIKDASKGYLSRFNVYRIFRDDVDYNREALETAFSGCEAVKPTIFTKTTIRNNPYLVEYMEASGILESEMANGQFDAEDVAQAQAKINAVRGTDTSDTEYEGDEYDIGDKMLDEEKQVKDDSKYF